MRNEFLKEVWFHENPRTWSNEPKIVTVEHIKPRHKKHPNYRLRDCEILTWTFYRTKKEMRADGWHYIGEL